MIMYEPLNSENVQIINHLQVRVHSFDFFVAGSAKTEAQDLHYGISPFSKLIMNINHS